MQAFDDITREIDERASERMHFRAKPHIKQAIRRAAALAGVDDSVFTMNAAYQAALVTINAHERTLLQSADHANFLDALDTPPAPADKLRGAFARHRSRIVSK